MVLTSSARAQSCCAAGPGVCSPCVAALCPLGLRGRSSLIRQGQASKRAGGCLLNFVSEGLERLGEPSRGRRPAFPGPSPRRQRPTDSATVALVRWSRCSSRESARARPAARHVDGGRRRVHVEIGEESLQRLLRPLEQILVPDQVRLPGPLAPVAQQHLGVLPERDAHVVGVRRRAGRAAPVRTPRLRLKSTTEHATSRKSRTRKTSFAPGTSSCTSGVRNCPGKHFSSEDGSATARSARGAPRIRLLEALDAHVDGAIDLLASRASPRTPGPRGRARGRSRCARPATTAGRRCRAGSAAGIRRDA